MWIVKLKDSPDIEIHINISRKTSSEDKVVDMLWEELNIAGFEIKSINVIPQ